MVISNRHLPRGSVVISNRHLPRGSKDNVFYTTITGNITMSRYVVLVVTILFLDFVMIHWIRWIQWHSSRKNFIGSDSKTLRGPSPVHIVCMFVCVCVCVCVSWIDDHTHTNLLLSFIRELHQEKITFLHVHIFLM